MDKYIEQIVCINKDLFNKLRLLTSNSSDLPLDENNKDYLVSKSIYDKLLNTFNSLLKKLESETILPVKGASLDRYNKLKNKYNSIIYGKIRNDFDKLGSTKIDEEKLLELKIELYEEINKIKQVPTYIKQIEKELKEIKDNNLSININSYYIRFSKLINNGGLLEEYISFKEELDLIIRKTYIDNINSSVKDDKNIYLVSNEGKIKILLPNNIDDFTYGFVYSPKSIKAVKCKGNNAFVSFNNIDYNSYSIELNDDDPIATYAVTYGEMDINPNYVKAQNLYSVKGIPFIELDKTKFIEKGKIDIKGLIDNLLSDKGIPVKDKDEDYYELYLPFFIEYQNMKHDGSVDKGKVINLFDFYFDAITSQRFLDLSLLLNGRYSPQNIKLIINNNIYYDFSIFRNTKTNKTKLKQFVKHFSDYKDNKLLNEAFPGICDILEELTNASVDKYEDVVRIINDESCHDSWLLYNCISPKHNNKKPVFKQVDSSERRLINEREQLLQLKQLLTLLKSMDEPVRK